MNLTNRQKEILLNLIEQEQDYTWNVNKNIEHLLRDYRKELTTIHKIISDSWEEDKYCM